MKNKQIIELIVIFIGVLIAGLLVHKVFLNLDYEILRSFIVATGATLWRFLIIIKRFSQRPRR